MYSCHWFANSTSLKINQKSTAPCPPTIFTTSDSRPRSNVPAAAIAFQAEDTQPPRENHSIHPLHCPPNPCHRRHACTRSQTARPPFSPEKKHARTVTASSPTGKQGAQYQIHVQSDGRNEDRSFTISWYK